jgi:hypothetical protein
MTKSLVENPQDLPEYDKIVTSEVKTNSLKSGTTSWSVPFYEYVRI